VNVGSAGHGKCSREPFVAINWVSTDALDALLRHTWPGNVRELRNTIARRVVSAAAR